MASRSIGTLTLDLVAKIGGFVDGMDKAQRETAKRAKEIEDSVSRIAKVTAGAAIAAATGVAALVKAQIDVAEEAYNAAQAAGVTTEQYTRLSYAMAIGVKDGGDLNKTLLNLNKSIAGAGDGVKGNVEDFTRLNVAYKNADGSLRNASDVLADVADRFAKMQDGAQKTALAVSLFGKTGADLIPLLNQGSAGLRQFADESDRLGNTISDKTGAAADAFNDNLDKLRKNITGAAMNLAGDLLPSLVDVTGNLVETGGLVDDLKDSFDEIIKAAEILAAVMAGRLAASVARSATSFAAAQIESLRYQATLAKMAGSTGIAAAATSGLVGAGRSLLAILGGPVGLAVTAATIGLSFIDWGDNAKKAAAGTQSLIDKANGLGKTSKDLSLEAIRADIKETEKSIKELAATPPVYLRGKLSSDTIETQNRLDGLRESLKKFKEEEARLSSEKTDTFTPAAITGKDVAVAKPDNSEIERIRKQLRESMRISPIDFANDVGSEVAGVDKEVERLKDKFKTEEDLIKEKRDKDMADWLSYSEMMRLSIEQHEAGVTTIEQAAADARAAIAQKERDAKFSVAKQMFGNLSTLMNSESRKMFEIGKAASLAGAIVSGIESVVNSYAAGSKIGGPPLGAAFAATAAIATGTQIQAIRAQKFGGGGASPAVSNTQAVNAASTPVGGAGAAGRNVYLHGIDPQKLYSGDQLLSLINTALADGGTLRTANV